MRGGRTFDCKKVALAISFAQLVIQGNTNQLAKQGNTNQLVIQGNTNQLVIQGNTNQLVKLVKQGNTNSNEDDGEICHCEGNATYIICGFLWIRSGQI